MRPLFPDKVCPCQAARAGEEEGPGCPDPTLYPQPGPEGSLELGQELQDSQQPAAWQPQDTCPAESGK